MTPFLSGFMQGFTTAMITYLTLGFGLGFYSAFVIGFWKIATMDAIVDPITNTPDVTRQRHLVAFVWPIFLVASWIGKYRG